MVENLQQDVLALGEPRECESQTFVIFAGQALPQATLFGAVDVCFKAFSTSTTQRRVLLPGSVHSNPYTR